MEEIIPFHRPMFLPQEEQNEIVKQIGYCMSSGILTNGKNARELEERIADIHNVEYAIATSSCSQGLVIALQSLNNTAKIPREAYTQAFTWYSTPYSILTSGIFPIFCDIDDDTWNMQQPENEHVELAVPVHTFGNISRIESEYKVYDGAHCLGSNIKDIGDATVISLAPTKIITSIEGGCILTNNSYLAKYAIELRDKVSRLSEIHAIFGNAYLDHLDQVLKWKREVFTYYKDCFSTISSLGIFQKTDLSNNHNTIGMLSGLKIPEHIETRKYYQPVAEVSEHVLPITKVVYDNIICLPSWYNCPYKKIAEDILNFNKNEIED